MCTGALAAAVGVVSQGTEQGVAQALVVFGVAVAVIAVALVVFFLTAGRRIRGKYDDRGRG